MVLLSSVIVGFQREAIRAAVSDLREADSFGVSGGRFLDQLGDGSRLGDHREMGTCHQADLVAGTASHAQLLSVDEDDGRPGAVLWAG